MIVCDRCGQQAPEPSDTLPLTWLSSVENGQRRVYCDSCAREHIRAIEAKLDSEWW